MGLLDNPLAMSMFASGPGLGNNNSLSRNLMQMRALRYMHEPVPRMSTGRNGVNMNPLNSLTSGSSDYSQFTFDPDARAAAEKALSPYGLHPLSPEQANPFALFPNSGFFGNHPRFTNALEGAMFGGAMTQGANTWGEGISNVLQGIIGGQQARHGLWERQFAAPFQTANTLEGLMDLQQKRELTSADIEWRRSEAQKNARDPMPKYTGHMAVDDGSVWAFDQSGNPKQLMPPGTVSKPDKNASPLGGSLEGKIIEGRMGPFPTDPDAPITVKRGKKTIQTTKGQDYWDRASQMYNSMAGTLAANRAAGGDAGHKDKVDDTRDYQAGQARQKFVASKSGDTKWLFSKSMDPNDPQLGQKLSDYYDNEIAPFGAGSPMPTDVPSNPYRK